MKKCVPVILYCSLLSIICQILNTYSRGRIPHYMWTTYICQSCACSVRFANHEYRTCMRLGNFTVLLERVGSKEGSELLFVLGPHWPFAIFFTAGLALVFPSFAMYVFWRIVPKVTKFLFSFKDAFFIFHFNSFALFFI